MTNNSLNSERYLSAILERLLPDGGFSGNMKGAFRPDATAWAILALHELGVGEDILDAARRRLAINQQVDGRVCLDVANPGTIWPTFLSILAWGRSTDFAKERDYAVQYLLSISGTHDDNTDKSIIGHDSSILGWPWTNNTHSWVEPTALTMIALALTGQEGHDRYVEATKLLLDRQLQHGGWNYGNTTVFGRELRPMLESTGIALSALCNQVNRKSLEKSIDYLKDHIPSIRTPFSLSWMILGLSSWGEVPLEKSRMVEDCFNLQSRYGPYNTQALSLLVLADVSEHGLMDLLGIQVESRGGDYVKE